MLGHLVRCLNCGLLWRYVAVDSNPGGTVPTEVLCYLCPKCGSNAWEPERSPTTGKMT